MSTLNKSSVPVASVHRSKLDLSCDHLTSMSFMQMQPVYYRHMLKGEKLSFDSVATIRPSAMPVPTFGSLNCHLRGFFVPYRLVFPHWESYHQDTIASNYLTSSLVGDVPLLPSSVVTTYFLTNGATFLNSVSGTANDNDFAFNGQYYKLTYLGLQRYKIFYSLGYDIICGDKEGSFNFNALGLLSYARVYADWYCNTQYLNSVDILRIKQLCSYNDPSSQLVLTMSDLDSIFKVLDAVVYDSNGYFESCWDNPVSPNSGQFSAMNVVDVTDTTSQRGVVTTLPNGTPIMQQNSASSIAIGTAYLHSVLKKVTDYMHRHAIAGALNIERALAEYGFASQFEKLDRSIYVGNDLITIGVGDIYATGAGVNGNESSVVGDYAGRAYGAGKKSWEFTSDEEGVFIVIASIVPSGGYYQGYDRNNRHGVDGEGKRSFFVPEFDALGVQVLEKGEVYVSRDENYYNAPQDYAGTFGFTGRYGEYKRAINRVSGMLSFPRIMAGGDSWHLMRDLTGRFNSISAQTHSLAFSRGGDAAQYNRIFNYQLHDYDNFFAFFHFTVAAYAPCKKLFDTYEFDDESSNRVTLQSNGAALN